MRLGLVGLGRMGASMARRLLAAGHECVVFDVVPDAVRSLASDGAAGVASLDEVVEALHAPRVVWLMVPAPTVGPTLSALAPLLTEGDVVVDGGNSNHRDTRARARMLSERGVHLVDVGTSGGVHGLDRGYCLMVGGDDAAVTLVEPVLAALAPGTDAAARTPGRSGSPSPEERGYLHCGPSGAGHFVKTVHNGIEYGLMAAYAEGLNILRHADAGRRRRTPNAETAPLEDPDSYRYDLDVAAIAELWRRGSVVGSWLLDLTAQALHESPDLTELDGHVADSGEGRWAVLAAVEEGVPAPVLTAALYERFASRGEANFANRVLSAMRRAFGGHGEAGPGS